MSGKSISFKRGDTFQLEGTRTNRAGAAVDLSGLTISSQARVGSFVDDLTVSVTSAATGEFILSATAAKTELWPVGNLYCDIQFVGAGTESTETFVIYAIEDITRAG